ncbi:DMT family transporter [Mailhella massiliensis]|uniref:DMT family transporter n=1 Tax=Mailhella massiliensis TaxID=1903261 RepID=A0A921DRN4_9BACT|nr:DMT family transporter [Mailhella massiliensis]HJD96182.1 DMT family transporter [Mailhella massiliensis]
MVFSPRMVMLLLTFCYALWGGGMIAMKYAFESFAVLHVVFARVAFAALFYLALFPKWRRLPYEKGDWKYLLLLVLFEPCLFFLCETFSMKFTTASQGGVIAACFPLCTAVAAWIFLKERLTRRTIAAIILAVLGVAGSSYFAEGDARASHPLLGNLLMFGAVLSSTGYAVCVRFISRRYSFLSISAIQAIGGSVAFLPALFSAPVPQSVTLPAMAGLLYMGVGVGILAYLLLNLSLRYLEAGVVSLFGNLIPVFTLIFAYVFLGERLNMPQVACVGLALFGVVISSTEKRA